MSNRLFQGIIRQMGDAARRTVGVIDAGGVVIACSELAKVGESNPAINEELAYSPDCVILEGFTYRAVGPMGRRDQVIFVSGDDDEAARLCEIMAISLSAIKSLNEAEYDKATFIKNIILDNILPSDIYIRSKDLNCSSEESRIVILFKFLSQTEVLPFNMIQQLFPDKDRDLAISIAESEVVLVKEVKPDIEIRELERELSSVADTLRTEFYANAVVGIGTVVSEMKDLARSYKEAQTAIEVGKVFDTEKTVLSYENLGIGRLVYQLPTTLCEMFLQEVFKYGSLESLDQETLQTIQCFFENSLNVSETSRKLFVHRNTLVYRLEKIRKLTGLDLREFDSAITLKVALMVKRYLTTKPVKF